MNKQCLKKYLCKTQKSISNHTALKRVLIGMGLLSRDVEYQTSINEIFNIGQCLKKEKNPMLERMKSGLVEHTIIERDGKRVSFDLIHCEEGFFDFGTNESVKIKIKNDHGGDEFWIFNMICMPKRLARIKYPFWLSSTQVSQELWECVMGDNPSYFNGVGKSKIELVPNNTIDFGINKQRPIDQVNWWDCIEFCNQLSTIQGLKPCYVGIDSKDEKVFWDLCADGYRLPFEVEWEYASNANSGFLYSGSNDKKDVAVNFFDDLESLLDQKVETAIQMIDKESTQGVKTKKPNAWGFYDMSGNGWETCMDINQGGDIIVSAIGIVNSVDSEILPKAKVNDDLDYYEWTNGYHKWQKGRVKKGGSHLDQDYCCLITFKKEMSSMERSSIVGLRVLRQIPIM